MCFQTENFWNLFSTPYFTKGSEQNIFRNIGSKVVFPPLSKAWSQEFSRIWKRSNYFAFTKYERDQQWKGKAHLTKYMAALYIFVASSPSSPAPLRHHTQNNCKNHNLPVHSSEMVLKTKIIFNVSLLIVPSLFSCTLLRRPFKTKTWHVV